jgi:hypothetical protein
MAKKRMTRKDSRGQPGASAFSGTNTAQRLRFVALAALTALLIAAPLIPGESLAETGTGCVLTLAAVALMQISLAIAAVLGNRRFRFDWPDVAVIALLAAVGVSAWLMASHGNPRATINAAWQWANVALLYLMVRQLVRTDSEIRALCAAMLGLATALAVLAGYQFFVTMPQTVAQYRADPEAVLRGAGVDAPAGTPERKLFEDRLESTEPTATFALANSLAGFTVPWLILALGIVLEVWRRRNCSENGTFSGSWTPGRSPIFGGVENGTGSGSWMHGACPIFGRVGRSLIAAVACCLTLAFCLLLTKSRTAVLATGVGCAALGWEYLRSGRRVDWRIPLAVLALFAVTTVGAAVAGAFDWLVLSEAPKSLLYRFEYWQGTLRMIADHPWLGCGPGNFQQYYTLYKLPEASETIADPHNFLLEVWATVGTLGMLAFAAFLVLSIWRGASQPEHTDPADPWPTSRLACQAIWIGALAGGLFAFPMGAVVGFPPAPALLWLGFPMGVAVVFLLQLWVADGKLPLRLLLISLLALLLNLSAAGGIGFAGVASSFWLLAALVVNRSPAGRRTIELPRWGVASLAVFGLVLLAACHQTMYVPVLTSQAKVSEAMDWAARGRLDQAESVLRQAAEADTAASQPWIQLASLYHAQLLSAPSPELLARFDDAVSQAQTRNKRSFSLHRQIGNWRLALYRRLADRRQLDAAREAYNTWVVLYPTSSLARAQLAWTYHLAEEDDSAAEQAALALRLDAATPHKERKLAVQQVYDADGTSLAGTNAEQLMQKLRNGRKP